MPNVTGSFGWFQTLLEEIEAAQADCEWHLDLGLDLR
jgi:hypothetical protein